jgi:hypothetical protein
VLNSKAAHPLIEFPALRTKHRFGESFTESELTELAGFEQDPTSLAVDIGAKCSHKMRLVLSFE